jgi:DNA helicase HerA-like ATPase
MATEDTTTPDTTAPNLAAARRGLYEQFASAPIAYSIDGSATELSAALDVGFATGDLVVVEIPGPHRPIVQIESLQVVTRTPVQLDIVTRNPDGSTTTGRGAPVLRHLEGTGSVVGTIDPDGRLVRGPTRPFHEAEARAATNAEIRLTRDGITGTAGPEVGTALDDPESPVRLRAAGFNRHTFLCGQSGSGKTYTTGVILEALRLTTKLPLVVLDPNSDHVRLAEVLADERDSPDGEAYGTLADELVVARARGWGGDIDLVTHFSDLPTPVLAALLRLDPIADLEEYDALADVVGALPVPFAAQDVIERAAASSGAGPRLAMRIRNLGVADWGLWCRPGETSAVEARLLYRQCVVIDLGSLDLPIERSLVTFVVLGALWQRRSDRQPRLVVVDEAHNAFPARPLDLLSEQCADLGTLIAGEGRKFGIHLLVATQRPGKVHEQVVAQCDNLVLLRMNSRDDVRDLTRTFSHVPAGMIERAPTLGLGEVLYAGPISPVPVFASTRRRLTPEGGADIPTDWATRRSTNPVS